MPHTPRTVWGLSGCVCSAEPDLEKINCGSPRECGRNIAEVRVLLGLEVALATVTMKCPQEQHVLLPGGLSRGRGGQECAGQGRVVERQRGRGGRRERAGEGARQRGRQREGEMAGREGRDRDGETERDRDREERHRDGEIEMERETQRGRDRERERRGERQMERDRLKLGAGIPGAARAGGDRSPACPWPGPPLASSRVGVRFVLSHWALLQGAGLGVMLPQEFAATLPGACHFYH